MRIPDSATPLVRRWYAVVLGLLLTLGAAFYVSSQAAEEYEAGAVVVLLPGESSVDEGGNPFLFLAGLGQARDVVLQAVNSPESWRILVGDDPTLDYIVEPPVGSATSANGPLIGVMAMAPSAQRAIELRDDVLELVPATLLELQENLGVLAEGRIRAVTVARDVEAQEVTGQGLRTLLVVVVVGIAMSLLSAGLLDVLIRARRRGHAADPGSRRDSRNQGEAPSPGVEPSEVGSRVLDANDDDEESQVLDPSGPVAPLGDEPADLVDVTSAFRSDRDYR